jgi:hypothetical protein
MPRKLVVSSLIIGTDVLIFQSEMLMALPSKVPMRISRMTTGVKPMFENATPMTPTKTKPTTVTNRNRRMANTKKLWWK